MSVPLMGIELNIVESEQIREKVKLHGLFAGSATFGNFVTTISHTPIVNIEGIGHMSIFAFPFSNNRIAS